VLASSKQEDGQQVDGLEIIIDLPIGFPINNIISLSMDPKRRCDTKLDFMAGRDRDMSTVGQKQRQLNLKKAPKAILGDIEGLPTPHLQVHQGH